MKYRNIIYILALSAVLASCSSNQEPASEPRAALQLNVSMAGETTRALKTEFATGDNIGISLIGADGSTNVYNQKNMYYTYYETSGWRPGNATAYTQGTTINYYSHVDVLTYDYAKVSAYYPYRRGADIDPEAIPVSYTPGTGSSQTDWLFAPYSDFDGVNKPFVNFANPTANLEMRHAHCLINILLSADTDNYGFLNGFTITGNMGFSGTLNSTTGSITDVELPEKFGTRLPAQVPVAGGNPVSLTWMVLPRTASPITITITGKIRNETLTATVPNVLIRSGYKINIPVLIKTDNITTSLVVSSVKIEEWTTTDQTAKETTPINN